MKQASLLRVRNGSGNDLLTSGKSDTVFPDKDLVKRFGGQIESLETRAKGSGYLHPLNGHRPQIGKAQPFDAVNVASLEKPGCQVARLSSFEPQYVRIG